MRRSHPWQSSTPAVKLTWLISRGQGHLLSADQGTVSKRIGEFIPGILLLQVVLLQLQRQLLKRIGIEGIVTAIITKAN